jgi:hypothetical protein
MLFRIRTGLLDISASNCLSDCVQALGFVLGIIFMIALYLIQGDQKVSVQLMITIQKIISNVQSVRH